MCIVRHVGVKKVFTFEPVKCVVSTNIRSAQPAVLLLNVPFRDQQSTNMLFGGAGTHCFARKMSRDYEKEKPSPFFEEVTPPITIKHTRTRAKNAETNPFMA